MKSFENISMTFSRFFLLHFRLLSSSNDTALWISFQSNLIRPLFSRHFLVEIIKVKNNFHSSLNKQRLLKRGKKRKEQNKRRPDLSKRQELVSFSWRERIFWKFTNKKTIPCEFSQNNRTYGKLQQLIFLAWSFHVFIVENWTQLELKSTMAIFMPSWVSVTENSAAQFPCQFFPSSRFPPHFRTADKTCFSSLENFWIFSIPMGGLERWKICAQAEKISKKTRAARRNGNSKIVITLARREFNQFTSDTRSSWNGLLRILVSLCFSVLGQRKYLCFLWENFYEIFFMA